MANISSNVIYVEPNYATSYSNGYRSYDADGNEEVIDGLTLYEMAPPLEDYCVAFQLAVQVSTNTTKSSTTNGNTEIILRCTDANGKMSVSLLQGTRFPIGDGENISYLTTAALETSLQYVKEESSTEMFGVKSIDISYNAYMTPEVTIKFVDIRAASLFSQEEMAHEHNGLMSSNLAASFFHCFFVMPYPLFGLTVKGFYGEAVSYELMLQSFNFKLDPSTGNYEAEAKFIGYTWSILSDVTLNAIVAAPYCSYEGEQYWNEWKQKSAEEGGFVTDEGDPLPTIAELVNAYRNLNQNVDKVPKTDPTAKRDEELTNRLQAMQSVYDAMMAAMLELKEAASESKNIAIPINNKEDWSHGAVIWGGTTGAIPRNQKHEDFYEKIKQIKELISANNLRDFPISFKDLETEASQIWTKPTYYANDCKDYFYKNGKKGEIGSVVSKSTNTFKNISNQFFTNLVNKTDSTTNEWKELDNNGRIYVFCVNLSEWEEYMANEIANLNGQKASNDAEMTEKMQLDVAKAIGMNPTLYNMMKVMVAHLQTLMYCIETCRDNIPSDRTYESTNLNNTKMVKKCDEKSGENEGNEQTTEVNLTPFPEVKVREFKEGRTVVEDGWLGELSDSDQLEEVKFVEAMVLAVDRLREKVESSGSTFENIDGSVGSISSAAPVVPSDVFIENPIYEVASINKDDIAEIAGVLALRGLYVLSAMKDIRDNASVAGAIDAVNLYVLDTSGLSSNWVNLLKNKSADDFATEMVNITTSSTPSGYLNLPWHESQNNPKDPLIISFDEGDDKKGLMTCYPYKSISENGKTVQKQGALFPIQNISFNLEGLGRKGHVSSDMSIYARHRVGLITGKGETLFKFTHNPAKISSVADVFSANEEIANISDISHIEDNFTKLKELAELKRGQYGEMFGQDNWFQSDYMHNSFSKKYGISSSNEPVTTKRDKNKISYTFAESIETMTNANYGTAFGTEKGKISDYSKGDLTKIKVWNGNAVKELTRDKDDNLGRFLKNEDENIHDWTIPRIWGVSADGRQNENVSVFTQECYINAKSDYERATLFLFAFSFGEYGIDIGDCITKFRDASSNGKNMFKVLPYTIILLLGAYVFWKEDFKTNGQSQIYYRNAASSQKGLKWQSYVSNTFDNIDINRVTESVSSLRNIASLMTSGLISSDPKQGLLGDAFDFINDARIELRNFLKEEFKLWVDGGASQIDGLDCIKFPTIHSELSLEGVTFATINSVAQTLSTNGVSTGTTLEKYLINTAKFNSTFFKNYISIEAASENDNYKQNNFKLYLRETSEIVDKLSELYIQPVLFVPFNEWLKIDGEDQEYATIDNLKSYFKGFHEKYTKLVGLGDEANKNTNPLETADVSKHIKIALYKYLKILYDKWLQATYYQPTCAEHWGVKEFFKKHFHFIDQNYVNCEDIYFDMKGMSDDFDASFNQETFSFLSFLSNALNKTQCAFYPVQNFLNYYNEESASKMKNMFKPIPYNDAFAEAPTPDQIYPDFVVMYKSEESHEPATEDGCGDSFMLNDDEQFLPQPIKDAGSDPKSLRIPSFGVSYGKQYQSYFQSIDVSTNSPMPTEQSLKAQYMIGAANSESNQQVQTLGQDLYTVYSQQSYTCTVQMMGDMWIQPTMYFVLTNVPTFRGSYLIQKVTHQITPGRMTTTFVGTRQASTTTPHVYNWYVGKNNQGGGTNGDLTEDPSRQASLENDCPYKVFTPGAVSGSGAWTEEMLNSTVQSFVQNPEWESNPDGVKKKQYYNAWANTKIIDFLAFTANREYNVNASDTLENRLIIATMFNNYTNGTWTSKPKSLGWFFQPYQVCLDTDSGTPLGSHFTNWNANEKLKNDSISAVKEVFLNTPAVLIGKTTSDNKGGQYKKIDGSDFNPNANIKSLYDKQVTLTYENLANLSAWAWPSVIQNSMDGNALAWNTAFKNNNHIHIGEKTKTPLWNIEPQNNEGEKTTEDDLKDLVEAIQKTCQYSDGISISNIHATYAPMGGGTGAKISVSEKMDSPSKDNATLFDIVLNAYSNYCDAVYWIVNDTNSPSDFPIYVVIIKNSDSGTQNFKACVASSSLEAVTDDATTSDSDHYGILNDFYYRSLAKKYINIGEDEENPTKNKKNQIENLADAIISEVPNFSFSSESEKIKEEGKKVFTLLQKFAPIPCNSSTTSSSWSGPALEGVPQNSKYQWYNSNNLMPPND